MPMESQWSERSASHCLPMVRANMFRPSGAAERVRRCPWKANDLSEALCIAPSWSWANTFRPSVHGKPMSRAMRFPLSPHGQGDHPTSLFELRRTSASPLLELRYFLISCSPTIRHRSPTPAFPRSGLRQGYDRQAGPATGSSNGLHLKSKFQQQARPRDPTGVCCFTSALRPQERYHLPTGFPIHHKVRIQGHDFRIFMNLRHSDQAGVRQ